MVVGRYLRLPEGYSAEQVGKVWYLADPGGAPLFNYPDATAVELFAWRHAWRTRHEAFEEEPAALHVGARSAATIGCYRPSSGPRDTAEAPPNPKRRSRRFKPVSRRVVAAAAAGATLGFVAGLGALGWWLYPIAPFLMPGQPTTSISAQPKPPGAGLVAAGLPEMERAAEAAYGVPKARYAVSVGSYTNPAAADRMKHLVRSKGYIVDVIRRGAVSRVMTRLFPTRAQAELVARVFEEIQLPAHLVTWRAI